MAINSCEKGKRGERAWAQWLQFNLNCSARRGRQYSGSPDSPDIVCESLPGIHCEVKAVERLNLDEAMRQAVLDAGPKIPYVAHKKNRGEWMITLRARDLKSYALLLANHLNKSLSNVKSL